MVRVGWLMDEPAVMGGAELEAVTLYGRKPPWANVVRCPASAVTAGLDVYVLHNVVTYTRKLIPIVEGAKIVKRQHDMWPDGDPALRRWVLASADLVLMSSPLQREEFPWRVGAPVELVPSAVDLGPFMRVRERNHRAGVVWLGRLHPSKGLEAARNWAVDNEQAVDVYGAGPMADKLPAPLRYCGPLDYEDVPDVLAGYEKLLFLPDVVEPYGRVVVEAWAAGCEVVANGNVGALWWMQHEPRAIGEAAARFWQHIAEVAGVDANRPELHDPYATHLPVLRAVCDVIRPVLVLEFGGGQYSTPLLSEHAERLTTVEADDGWRAKLRGLVNGNVELLASFGGTVADYDLIFIDDGQRAEERAATIRRVADEKPSGVVVVHDFDNAAYQDAAAGFERRRVFDGLTPHTALLWNGERPELEGLAL